MPVFVGTFGFQPVDRLCSLAFITSIAKLASVGSQPIPQRALFRGKAGPRLMMMDGQLFESFLCAFSASRRALMTVFSSCLRNSRERVGI